MIKRPFRGSTWRAVHLGASARLGAKDTTWWSTVVHKLGLGDQILWVRYIDFRWLYRELWPLSLYKIIIITKLVIAGTSCLNHYLALQRTLMALEDIEVLRTCGSCPGLWLDIVELGENTLRVDKPVGYVKVIFQIAERTNSVRMKSC